MIDNLAKANGLPGSFFSAGHNVKRWWWRVTLPGETRRQAIPLRPEGSEFATDDPGVAVEVARMILERAQSKLTGPRAGFDGTIRSLCDLYLKWAESYYVNPITHEETGQVSRVRTMIRQLKLYYAETKAERFDQLCLKDWRTKMIAVSTKAEKPIARNSVNSMAGEVRAMFKWAAGEKMIPASLHYALTMVKSLGPGRGMGARETETVMPVDVETVKRTLPWIPPVPADMVSVQLQTGMRSTEICLMRLMDIEIKGDVWLYKPMYHKNSWRQHERIVPLNFEAQRILKKYMTADRRMDEFIFSPAESRRAQFAARRAARKTPLRVRELARRAAIRKNLPLSPRYNQSSYRLAITRAIIRANAAAKAAGGPYIPIPHWHPHQIRHAVAFLLRNTQGLDAARAMLGHKTLGMTDTYGPIDQKIAIEAARKLA